MVPCGARSKIFGTPLTMTFYLCRRALLASQHTPSHRSHSAIQLADYRTATISMRDVHQELIL
jgi:hypothetical protein